MIFDFDYTLADSSRGIIDCVDAALARVGLPGVPADEVRGAIGLPLRLLFERLAGPQHQRRFDEFFRLFVERADLIMTDATVMGEEVPEVLRTLKSLGLALGIVSTKFRYRIEAVLERERLRGLFDVIIGGEDVSSPKPDPEGLRAAMKRLGRAPADTLFVGDSETDAETASRASVRFAAVLTGVTPRERFAAWKVHGVLERLSELPALLAR